VADLQTAEVVDFSKIPGVDCPCGSAQRAFADSGQCTLHTVTISADAATHYHKTHTEVYYFLEGSGQMELDGQLQPVKPGMSIFIPPGVRHRAVVGDEPMKILNFVMPPFDPADEYFD
jgi:mannose-6-phosphate isomerase-like protein (cupin superfamily)